MDKGRAILRPLRRVSVRMVVGLWDGVLLRPCRCEDGLEAQSVLSLHRRAEGEFFVLHILPVMGTNRPYNFWVTLYIGARFTIV